MATHDINKFELDRNAQDVAGGGDDWDTLLPGVPDPSSDLLQFTGVFGENTATNPLGSTGTQFHAGGSKDDLDVQPQWLWNPGEPLDKDDITNAYAAAYTGPDNNYGGAYGDANTDPDLYLYFGLDRFANNGSAQVGFWFFQNDIGLTTTASGGGYKFSGVHRVGDVLVQSNFSNGGVISNISVFKWVGSGGTNGSLDLLFSAADCIGPPPSLNDPACATVNQATTPAPWSYTPKFPDPANPTHFPAGSFFEGGINLSALVPGIGCITDFMAETRSSTPFDSRLKDFALGNFQLCGANIQITPNGVNQVGTNHAFTAHVNKKDSSTGFVFANAAGQTVVGSITSGPGSFVADGVDSNGDGNSGNDCVTAASGNCTLTITSAVTGVTTVSASAAVALAGDGTVNVSTNGQGANSGPATKRWVNARISIQQSDTNQVNDPHTFTVTVQKDVGDGAGFVAAAGVNVSSTISGTGGITGGSCGPGPGATDASGQCTVTVNSATPGVGTVHASGTVTINGVNILVATNGYGAFNISNQKTWVDARISITPNDTNGITEPHTFTVLVEQNLGAGWVAAAGVAVSSTSSGVGSITGGTCGPGPGNTDAAGQCTVTVNSNTAGVGTVHASGTVTIGSINILVATNGYGAFTIQNQKTWVDGSLRWLKKDDQGNLLGGATFEVCATAGTAASAGHTPLCVTVLDNSAPDADPDAGEFQLDAYQSFGGSALGGLAMGTYTIDETVPPAGYIGDDFVESITLTIGDPDKTATHVWINIPPREGCTPGFWTGGNGSQLWNEADDPQWPGALPNPFDHTTLFNSFFTPHAELAGLSMFDVAQGGGGPTLVMKTARMLVAAYLNSTAGINFGITPADLSTAWTAFVNGGGTDDTLFNTLSAANNRDCPL